MSRTLFVNINNIQPMVPVDQTDLDKVIKTIGKVEVMVMIYMYIKIIV